jgi:hypothetical protein
MSLLALALLLPSSVLALTVSPPRQTVTVAPGETAELPLYVINEERVPVVIKGEVDAFRIDQESGTAMFGQPDRAKTWIIPREKKVVLQPGESASLTFDVRIPEGALPGAHYMGVFASAAAGEGNVGAKARIGSLVFLHVAGEVHEEARIVDVSTKQFIVKENTAEVYIRVENLGDIHIIPEGTVTLIGEETQTPINVSQEKVLADHAHTMAVPVPLELRHIGKQKARVAVTYGVTQQQLFEEVTFYYVPLWLRFAAGGIFLLLVIGASIFFTRK